MMKFKQILALVFAISLGYGLGQQGGGLYATDYPTGSTGITASSTDTLTNKTIDANGTGNSITNIDLSADVTGTLPHASTSNDAAQVHGLPANANVLGNLTASGKFIQHLQTDDKTVGSADTAMYIGATAGITYATAFSATPIVLIGATESDVNHFAGASKVTTTTFDLFTIGTIVDTAHLNIGWIAVGA